MGGGVPGGDVSVDAGCGLGHTKQAAPSLQGPFHASGAGMSVGRCAQALFGQSAHREGKLPMSSSGRGVGGRPELELLVVCVPPAFLM